MGTLAQIETAIRIEEDVTAGLKKIDEDNESIKLIPKVPESLRERARGAYDPQVISIGPYHWGKPQLAAMEKEKRLYLEKFLNRNQERGLLDYIKEIQSLESELRSCYDKDIFHKITNADDFLKIMLVDGCFVVEFCLQRFEKGDYGVDHSLYLIGFDMLFLLENQLPFFLLQRIYDMAAPTITTDTTTENLASPRLFARVALQLYISVEFHGQFGDVDPDHFTGPLQTFPKTFHFIHLRHSLYVSYYSGPGQQMFEAPPVASPDTVKKHLDCSSIPSATELHNSGIKFKIHKSVGIEHAKFDGRALEISQIFLNNDRAAIVLNTIAFERLHIHVKPRFSSFYRFMDLLVNTPEDVVLLRKYGLIRHDFGSEEEVANFFSHLTRGISPIRAGLVLQCE